MQWIVKPEMVMSGFDWQIEVAPVDHCDCWFGLKTCNCNNGLVVKI
jgi:hypothetical protein